MGKVFFWMQNPPDPAIVSGAWSDYLDLLALVSIVAVAVTAIVTVLAYRLHASRRKVHRPNDLFEPYTPMRWLLLTVIPAIVVGVLAAVKYEPMLKSTLGEAGAVLQTALLTGSLCVAFAYLFMLMPRITPIRFRYRPWWLFYRHRGVKV
jgi:heme/copper-type cytochrome/quinol oxidase subunit 2